MKSKYLPPCSLVVSYYETNKLFPTNLIIWETGKWEMEDVEIGMVWLLYSNSETLEATKMHSHAISLFLLGGVGKR